MMKRIATHLTPWQTIGVWGTAEEVEFRVTGAVHAWWHARKFLTGLAWDNIAAAVLSHPAPAGPRRLLMLGLGGGTSLRTLRHLCPEMEMTAVELDPDMILLARRHMRLDNLRVDVIEGDAYAWLRANRRKFDVIFDDVYGVTAEDVERPLARLDALLPAIRRGLAPGGVFAANLVTGPGHRRVQTAFRDFFAAAFPAVRVITTPDSLNECLVGGGGPAVGDDPASPPLRPWVSIRALANCFPQDSDYTWWRTLRARALPRRAGL